MYSRIDARGASCPQPVLMTKKALEESPEGIEVIVDNNTALMNVKRFMENSGYKINVDKVEDDEFIIGAFK